MLPEFSYDTPKEQVSDRLLRIYSQGTLSGNKREALRQPAYLIQQEAPSENSVKVTTKELERVMKIDKITNACVVETRNTNEQLTYLNSQQQYNQLPSLQFKSTQSMELSQRNISDRNAYRWNLHQLHKKQKRSQEINDLAHRTMRGGPAICTGTPPLSHQRALSKQMPYGQTETGVQFFPLIRPNTQILLLAPAHVRSQS